VIFYSRKSGGSAVDLSTNTNAILAGTSIGDGLKLEFFGICFQNSWLLYHVILELSSEYEKFQD
jgi:hypothetical protein